MAFDQVEVREDALRVPRGIDYAIAWPVVNADGEPIDLSVGYTARAQARYRADEPDPPLQEWSSGSGGAIDLTDDGKVVLDIPGVMSRDWDWEHAVYDVVLTGPNSSMFIVSSGGIEVVGTVTR